MLQTMLEIILTRDTSDVLGSPWPAFSLNPADSWSICGLNRADIRPSPSLGQGRSKRHLTATITAGSLLRACTTERERTFRTQQVPTLGTLSWASATAMDGWCTLLVTSMMVIGWTTNSTGKGYSSKRELVTSMLAVTAMVNDTARASHTGRSPMRNWIYARYAMASRRTRCSTIADICAPAWNARSKWRSVRYAARMS